MNRTIISLIAIFMCFFPVFSQEKSTSAFQIDTTNMQSYSPEYYYNKMIFSPERYERANFNEISVLYGFFPITPGVKKIDMGDMVLDHKNGRGSFAAGYTRYIWGGMSAIGGFFGYQAVDYTYVPYVEGSGPDKVLKMNAFYIMPVFRQMWFNKKHYAFYTQVGLGAILYLYDNWTLPFFAIQMDLLGIDFGNDFIRGFVEIGVGTTGIIKCGAKCSF